VYLSFAHIVFSALGNEPVGDYRDKTQLGSELAVGYAQIRDHKKRTECTKN